MAAALPEPREGYYWLLLGPADEWTPGERLNGAWWVAGSDVPCEPFAVGPEIEPPKG